MIHICDMLGRASLVRNAEEEGSGKDILACIC